MSKSISVPRPGIEPVVPSVEVQSLNHWTDKEVHVISLKILCVFKNMEAHYTHCSASFFSCSNLLFFMNSHRSTFF